MTDDNPTPDDYDKSDGFNEQNGIEECPHCGVHYSGNGGHLGEVYDTNGRQYEQIYDSNPGDGPFFCSDCWDELEANRRAQENHGLTDYQ